MGKSPRPKASRPNNGIDKFSVFLGYSWWQGIAGIVGLIALLVAFATYCLPITPDGGSQPSLAPLMSPGNVTSPPSGNSINGNCNAQGNDNEVVCAQPAGTASLGDVELDWPQPSDYLFAGRASELPTPPKYGKGEASYHCPKWKSWAQSQPKLFARNPISYMYLASGSPDLVVVRSIRVLVFNRYETPQNTILVRCNHRGGGLGYSISIDLEGGKVKVSNDETGKEYFMPPGSLSITGPRFETVAIKIESRFRYVYEGSIEVDALVNGKPILARIGTVESPLRWVNDPTPDQGTYYDWDVRANRWEKNFIPFGGV